MAIKKSELYSSLWKSCDALRGGMDASQYKDYVLVLLFVKYLSDKYAGQKNALIKVPAGGVFSDLAALRGDPEIGDKTNKIIGRLADASNLKGTLDVADFNDSDKLGKGHEMVDRLSNLIAIFDAPALDFRGNRAEGDDILGDAYEYLMRHFATQSGKSKGQFYTPAEVSRIMAKVIGLASTREVDQTIYDPTCGSGSLLLKAHDEARGASGKDLAIYGQEMDNATAALARMNMILHDCPTAEVWQDNTLSAPHFRRADGGLQTFDFAVANPPFSTKAWSQGFLPEADEFGRFQLGVPPTKNGDYAFLLHVLASLKSSGKGAVILPHGVLFRGHAEADIRRELVCRGVIKGIIGLPANLFFGTGIPACIIVLDKENAAARRGIFMIDAARGFLKDGNKNRLRAQDIHKIVDVFNNRAEVPRYSRMVPRAEIEANEFNLNLPRYIDAGAPEDLHDLEAHLRGGIPARDLDALAAYWDVFPAVRAALFQSARQGYAELRVDSGEIKNTIYHHPEFVAFNAAVMEKFQRWQAAQRAPLRVLAVGDSPKKLIETLSESLLETFRRTPLLNAYDTYQHLMNFWAATMQDDVYLLVRDGWKPDGGVSTELVPRPLIIARYFADEARGIAELEAKREAWAAQIAELEEEQGGEDGLFADAKNDKGKITRDAIKARLKIIAKDEGATEERDLLRRWESLGESESAAAKAVKAAQIKLNAQVAAKYGALSEDEVKTLVVDDKWLATLGRDVASELGRVSQALAARVQQLAARYEAPLPALSEDARVLAARVASHLQQMGATP